ncbi:DUF1850 domain-containing protein [Halobacillus fulvus]|nr:DUF1850 domain-containing protein [Halobacillus fulvus]
MKKKSTLLVLNILLTLGLLIPVSCLEVTAEGHRESMFPFIEGETFSIRWEHSVEKEDWEEMFKVEKGTIGLTGTRFKTFGAGVPNDAGEDTYLKNGWVHMTGINQAVGKDMTVRSGPSTDHRFLLKKYEIDFRPQTAYRISVVREPLLNAIIEKLR